MKKPKYTYKERNHIALTGLGRDTLNLEFATHRLIKEIKKSKIVLFINKLLNKFESNKTKNSTSKRDARKSIK